MKANEILRRIPAVEQLVIHLQRQNRANWLDHENTEKHCEQLFRSFYNWRSVVKWNQR